MQIGRQGTAPLDRRDLLTLFAASGLALFTPFSRQALAQVRFAANPFTLGVAAGDPAADGFVIWTRLAPEPQAIGYGVPRAPVEVKWEVAADEAFSQIVQSGAYAARPELAHSVHVEVFGLQPRRPYFYRFTAGGVQSPVGRARTAPPPGAPVEALRFGVAGCQHYEEGYFTAYRKLSEETLDFIFHYGDYIYEYHTRPRAPATSTPRRHFNETPYSLDDYRRHYAQYKADPDLQAAHAAHAFFCTWDDHEIENNWTGAADAASLPPELFALRRQAAAQAYYEHMPLRKAAFPTGPNVRLFRRTEWGSLAQLNFLDTRQYRSDQPCGDKYPSTCPGIDDPKAQVLGQVQERWLVEGLAKKRARWNVMAQQVMMMDLDRSAEHGINPDSWAGYRTPRNRLLSQIRFAKVQNLVVLTGDEHRHYAGEVHLDGRRPGVSPVGVEFVGTSVTSGGDGSDTVPGSARILSANPGLKLVNNQRGYMVCEATPQRWLTEMKVLDQISRQGGTLSTRAKVTVSAGSPRLHVED